MARPKCENTIEAMHQIALEIESQVSVVDDRLDRSNMVSARQSNQNTADDLVSQT